MFSNLFYFLRLLFAASPALVIGELASVLGVKYVIDIVTSGRDLKRLYAVVAVVVALLALCRLASYLYREFFWNVQREKAYYRLNRRLYAKAAELDLASYDDPEFYNRFILTIESSGDNIQNLLGLVRRYFGNLISLIAISSVLLTIDPLCLVIILASILLFLPLSKAISNLQVQRQVENTRYHRRSDYFQRLFYLQDYAKEVRMNGIAPLLMERYDQAAEDVIACQKKYYGKITRRYLLQETGVQVLGFMFVLPMYLGYLVLVRHQISPGDFVASFNGAYAIAMSLNFLTVWGVAQFDERAKLIEKYRAFLHAEPTIRDGAQAAPKRRSGEIKLEHLTFTYPGGAAPVLQDINLTIHPGEKIALVGYNGAGKTTLTNLLLRLYEPSGGRILIGGVGENVALSPQFDSERVRRALDHSGFQRPLPRGVDTQLLREFDDDGLMLSGGESQKVAVARAFYKDCPFVILDEPSANLDPVAEYQLNRAMLEAARDKTVIFISHRLSTTVQADKIYVMEQGRIIESGSHSELMAADGIYAYMFRLQAEKYKNAKSE